MWLYRFFDEIGVEVADGFADADGRGDIEGGVEVQADFEPVADGVANPLEAAAALVDVRGADIAGDLAEVGAPAAGVEVAEEAGGLAGLPAIIDTLLRPALQGFSAGLAFVVDAAEIDGYFVAGAPPRTL